MMQESGLKKIMDQAFACLLEGEIAKATACFQQVIDNESIFGGYAARVAQQRILWYCVPLEAVLKQVEQSSVPVDIHVAIANRIRTDFRYKGSELQNLIKSTEEYLTKIPNCLKVGQNFWTLKSKLDRLAEQASHWLQLQTEPVPLKEVYRREWKDFCQTTSSFPDHISVASLVQALETLHIKTIGHQFVISEHARPSALEAFAALIRQRGKPLNLHDTLSQVFPSLAISSETTPILMNFLYLNLDNRFVELSAGFYLTFELLYFDKDPFLDLFGSNSLDISTHHFIYHRYPSLIDRPLLAGFLALVETQLSRNPHLILVNKDSWLGRTRYEDIYKRVIAILTETASPVEINVLVKDFTREEPITDKHAQWKTLIVAVLHANKQTIFEVSPGYWLHQSAFAALAAKACTYLMCATRYHTVNDILGEIINLNTKLSSSRAFIYAFESYLRADQRFSEIKGDPSRWHTILSDHKDNDAVYDLFATIRHPIPLSEVDQRLKTPNLQFNLTADNRFKSFPFDLWGLSSWVWLNDFAYEYLLQTGFSLHQKVITNVVCKQNRLSPNKAIFLPRVDLRFAQDRLNRWYCRYQLTENDLQKLLAELGKYGGAGRKLDLLFQSALRKAPVATDAATCLPEDDRFIQLDNLWYSRQAAFYNLVPADVETIHDYLALQPDSSPPLPLKDLLLQAIGHDGRLTDAPDWLRQDPRFLEIHEGFWILSSHRPPGFERARLGGIAVFGTSPSPYSPDVEVALPETLTQRKRRSVLKSKSVETPKKIYITLSHMDIFHGNLRASGTLKDWIPQDVETIPLTDEEGNAFLAYYKHEASILNIRDWLQKRGITYGDKIYFQPIEGSSGLFVCPYGKRDERVYQEALHHQDIEKLIEEARRVNKTYHDLMIEVMEAFGFELHREDIYQLVDYHRTAKRTTIFEILSLSECPYEELRYFVSVGKGYWTFNRQRKEAYDMKMQELLNENSNLLSQITVLQGQLESFRDLPSKVSTINKEIDSQTKQISHLQAEKATLSVHIREITAGKKQTEAFSEQLQAKITDLEKHLSELLLVHSNALIERDTLRDERGTFLKELNSAQEKLISVQTETKQLHAKLSGQEILVKDLQSKLEASTLTITELQTQSTNVSDSYQSKLNTLQTEYSIKLQRLTDELSKTQQILKETQESASSELVEMRAQVQLLETQVVDLQTHVNESQIQIRETAQAQTALQAEKQSLVTQLEQSENKLCQLREKIASQVKVVQNQLKHQVAELDQCSSQIIELQMRLSTTQTEKASLQEAFETEKSQLEGQIKTLEVQMENLKEVNEGQLRELVTLRLRVKHIAQALSSSMGRFVARLFHLN